MEIVKKKTGDYHTEKKSWGWEEWIVNNDLYCGKRLHFTEHSGKTSLHWHVNKHETMYVDAGRFQITVINTVNGTSQDHVLEVGDSIVIPPNTPHRIMAIGPSVLLEFSTHHENSDSYRIKK